MEPENNGIEFEDDNKSRILMKRTPTGQRKRIRKLTFEWNEEMTIKLIKKIEKYEFIWNTCHHSYKDRERNKNAWETIGMALKLPRNEVVTKWNVVRGNYRMYLKNHLETNSSQRSTLVNRRYNPVYSYMSFLDPVFMFESTNECQPKMMSRPSSPDPSYCSSEMNMDDADCSIIETPEFINTPMDGDPMPMRPESPKRPRSRNAHESLVKCNEKEWDAFGNMIASNLRAWSAESMTFARRYKAALSAVNAQFESESINLLS